MLLICRPGRTADDTLATRLNALPVSVGENRILTRQSGENWVAIGIRVHVGFEHLRRANAGNFTAAPRLRIPGRHLVRAYVKNGLVINLPELMVYRWENGRVVEWYPISIGRVTARWHTPLGQLRIVTLERNPTWHRPDWAGGGTVPPGPRNPLGDRWIGLNREGYGLHGTNDPTSIGRTVSHGCIRLFPPHIRELFDAVKVGMPAVITYETITIGQQNGIVYLSVFPDIYGYHSNAVAVARRRLATFGLANALPAAELRRRLRQTDGVAHPILGSPVSLWVNGTRKPLTTGVTFHGGTAYAPLRELATALGAKLTWDANTRAASLTRGINRVTINADATQNFVALGALFVPIRPLAHQLGGIVNFTGSRVYINIGL